MVFQQRVFIIDIETSPIEAYVWELGKQYVSLSQMKKDWYIMAWGGKWLGDPDSKVIYHDTRNAKSDKKILKPLRDILDEADIILTQNGVKFDTKKINARFMLNGLKKPKPYTQIDTYRIVKAVADFTSNSLEYLTSKFCKKHKKTSHGKYSGIKLWIECLKGNKDAWDEMKAYNIKDVLSTEELYLNIRAWAPDAMPKVFPLSKYSSHCGTCGYRGKMRTGRDRYARRKVYQQNSCPKCGSWQPLKEK